MANLLLTGVRGFLGGRVLSKLSEQSDTHNIVVVDRKKTQSVTEMSCNYQLSTWNDIKAYAAKKNWTIVHMANSNSQQTNYGMISALGDFIDAAKDVNMIMMSSVSIYGSDMSAIRRDTDTKPETEYGRMKLHGEKHFTEVIDRKNNSCMTLIRSSAILGSGMPATFIKRLRSSMVAKERIGIARLDSLYNNCMYVDTMVNLVMKAIEITGKQRRIYVTGGLEPITLRELALVLSGQSMDGFIELEPLLCEDIHRKGFYIDEELIRELPLEIQIRTSDHVRMFMEDEIEGGGNL